MDAEVFDVDWPSMLRSALDGCGMRAVYQPIVDVSRGVVVGYEALIRFVGYPVRSPEPWFAAAHEHGVSAELQAAALRAALADRSTLPANCFLTVNIGPEVLHTARYARSGRTKATCAASSSNSPSTSRSRTTPHWNPTSTGSAPPAP